MQVSPIKKTTVVDIRALEVKPLKASFNFLCLLGSVNYGWLLMCFLFTRGYPPEHTPGQASLFERLDEESPERETSTRIDYTASSIDETADISQTDVAQNLAIGKQLKVGYNQQNTPHCLYNVSLSHVFDWSFSSRSLPVTNIPIRCKVVCLQYIFIVSVFVIGGAGTT